MPDDLPVIDLKRTLGLGVDGRHHIDIGHRIRPALGDGISEELKDIVVLPSVEPVMGGVPDLLTHHRILYLVLDIVRQLTRVRGMHRTIPRLPGSRKTAQTAAQDHQES
jgi:hypothetical protein